jgi:ABC-2 type transport system permease protein
MWLRIVTLIQKEVLAVLRDPRNRMALVLPPILQLFLFSFTGTLEVKHVALGIWNQDYGQVSQELIQRLYASPNFGHVEFAHSRQELQQMVDEQRVMLTITFLPDFSRRFSEGQVAPLQMIADGRKSNSAQIAQGYVSQVVNQFVSEQVTTGNAPDVQVVERTWFNPNLDYIGFTLPSLAVMITLQICLNVTAMSVAREREMGTFEQLLVSPMQPLEIMAGKSIPALILALCFSDSVSWIGPIPLSEPDRVHYRHDWDRLKYFFYRRDPTTSDAGNNDNAAAGDTAFGIRCPDREHALLAATAHLCESTAVYHGSDQRRVSKRHASFGDFE